MTLRPATVATLILVAVFLAVDTATQLAFKGAAEAIGDIPLGLDFLAAAAGTAFAWLAVGLYLATYVLWMLVLRTTALSRAFPLTALSYVSVPLFAWLAFGETVDARTAAGIGLILLGVALVGHGEDAEADAVAKPELTPCET
ncbi:EamA family transporter [Xanthobacter sp. 91]|uniref:EamA family transporter n=1 Tax=Xanthobacter sp. 91 TaxID=1117244 RepID=UPI0004958F97|nr:EamA family transporter [Xanthobacter sp. 91]